MKKFSYLFVLFLSVFSFNFVYARSIEGSVNTDGIGHGSENINIFSEVYNYSPFFQFLNTQQSDLRSFLSSKIVSFDDYYLSNYNISIFKLDDFRYGAYKYNVNIDYNKYTDLDPNVIFESIKNHVVFPNGKSFSDISYVIYFTKDYDYLDIVYDSNIKSDTFYIRFTGESSASYRDGYFFFFDSNGKYITYESSRKIFTSDSTIYYDLTFGGLYDDPDLTRLYSYLYDVGNLDTKFDYTRIYARYFYINDVKYETDGNAGYNAWQNFWKGLGNIFTGSFEINFSRSNLDFIYKYPFYSDKLGFHDLVSMWFFNNSITIPDNLVSYAIADYEKGFLLIPKSGCDVKDYMIYYSAQTTLDRHKLYLNYYSLSDSKDDLVFKKSIYVTSSQNNYYYTYNPFLDIDSDLDVFLNHAIHIFQKDFVSSFYIYYNPNCYSGNSFSPSIKYEFSDGSSVTLSKNDLNYLYNTYSNDSSNGVPNSSSGLGSSNAPTSSESSSNSFDLGTIASNIPNFAGSFVNSISSLVGITTVFFTSLPPEIFSILISVFSIGMIILVIKLFL